MTNDNETPLLSQTSKPLCEYTPEELEAFYARLNPGTGDLSLIPIKPKTTKRKTKKNEPTGEQTT